MPALIIKIRAIVEKHLMALHTKSRMDSSDLIGLNLIELSPQDVIRNGARVPIYNLLVTTVT